MIIVGLTGNYGVGKSTVTGMFRELGAKTIDTDEIVRELLKSPEVVKEITGIFGDDAVKDGSINRQWLADTVFRHPPLRIALENVLHPMVFSEIERAAKELAASGQDILIAEATVIFERGYQSRFDKIITVYVEPEVHTKRLADKGIGMEEAERRLSSQLPAEIKVRGSDFVIDNSSDMEGTREQVRMIYQDLLAAGKKNANN